MRIEAAIFVRHEHRRQLALGLGRLRQVAAQLAVAFGRRTFHVARLDPRIVDRNLLPPRQSAGSTPSTGLRRSRRRRRIALPVAESRAAKAVHAHTDRTASGLADENRWRSCESSAVPRLYPKKAAPQGSKPSVKTRSRFSFASPRRTKWNVGSSPVPAKRRTKTRSSLERRTPEIVKNLFCMANR